MSTEDNDPCFCALCIERRELKEALAAARALCGEAYEGLDGIIQSLQSPEYLQGLRDRLLAEANKDDEAEKGVPKDCEHSWHYAHEDGTRCPDCEEKG